MDTTKILQILSEAEENLRSSFAAIKSELEAVKEPNKKEDVQETEPKEIKRKRGRPRMSSLEREMKQMKKQAKKEKEMTPKRSPRRGRTPCRTLKKPFLDNDLSD